MSGLFEYLTDEQHDAVLRPKVDHYPKATPPPWATLTLEAWRSLLPLGRKTAVMYNKAIPVPREECWFGPRAYTFGGRTEHPQPWPDAVVALRRWVEEKTGATYDSCFVNYYRDGDDHIPWHADDEAWIREPIASVSFGASRRFCMKPKAQLGADRVKAATVEYLLGHGDLLVMHEGVQATWLHRVPPTRDRVGPRLNFTFRGTK